MKAGFCGNSRRWLFKLVLDTPRTCVYREQGNNECGREKCSYYEEREIPRHMLDDYNAYRSLAGLEPVKR